MSGRRNCQVLTISLCSGRVNGVDYADAEMKAHYDQGNERDRLGAPKGALEFVRTQEIVLRRLPAAPGVVADIGGGPGRYAMWLAELGYEVEHRDVIDLHVEQLQTSGHPLVRTAVGDARSLDLPDSSVDAVLLLGPMYHLSERAERIRTFREARRVPERGPIFIATISRWAARLDGVLQERLYEHVPDVLALLPESERTGNLPPVVPGGFLGFTHRPDDLADESPRRVYDLTTSSVSKACRSQATTWRSASRIPRPGMWYSMPHAPSNVFLNYLG